MSLLWHSKNSSPKMKTFTHPNIVPNLYDTKKKHKKKTVHAALSTKLCGHIVTEGDKVHNSFT